MKVKVGNEIIDSQDEPIAIILSPQDKENIKNMPVEAETYAVYPKDYSEDEARNWVANLPEEVANRLFLVENHKHLATTCSKCNFQLGLDAEAHAYCLNCGRKFQRSLIVIK